MAQPPIGTAISRTTGNGTVQYFSSGGKYLGKSNSNSYGGANYYDNRGMYSKTSKSGLTERRLYSRWSPFMEKSSPKWLTSAPKSGTIGKGK